MDYKPMSIKTLAWRKQTGMTLMELLIAMGVSFVIIAVIGSLSLWSGKSFAAMANYADLDNASRNALDRMTREIREVKRVDWYKDDGNQKELKLIPENEQPLYFRYNRAEKTLKRVSGGISETLL